MEEQTIFPTISYYAHQIRENSFIKLEFVDHATYYILIQSKQLAPLQQLDW